VLPTIKVWVGLLVYAIRTKKINYQNRGLTCGLE